MEHAKILPLAEMINIFATPATGITIPAILFLRYNNNGAGVVSLWGSLGVSSRAFS